MVTMSEFLPIGSIVKLKKFERKLMITGILQYVKDRPSHRYDYIGVLYPEGDVGSRFKVTFNNEDIDTVIFRGYEDEEREKLFSILETALKN